MQLSREEKKLFAAFKDVFESPNGKLVLGHLKEMLDDRTTFVKGDPYTSAFNEGRRSIFLDIQYNVVVANKIGRKEDGGDESITDEPE